MMNVCSVRLPKRKGGVKENLEAPSWVFQSEIRIPRLPGVGGQAKSEIGCYGVTFRTVSPFRTRSFTRIPAVCPAAARGTV